MDKQEYLRIRNDSSADMLPVVHTYYLMKGGIIKDEYDFMVYLGKWILRNHLNFGHAIGRINVFVIRKMDQHFGVYQN